VNCSSLPTVHRLLLTKCCESYCTAENRLVNDRYWNQ